MSQRIPRNSLIGMKNCGNTCYFNSVIQMLFDIREFREGILRSNSSEIPIPQLRRIFTQLKEPVVAEAYRFKNFSKVLDIMKFEMDLIPTWINTCKLRKVTEFPGSQEDAAEFMQKCILNRFAGTPLIYPLEVVTRLRYDYINFGTSRSKAELDAIPIIQLNVYYYKENEKISTLIENFFNIHQTQPNSETSKNFWERKVLQNNPNYMIFSFDRTSFTDDKIDRNIILEDSIPIGGEQYNLYSVVVHKGTTMNEGHYMYLFKENNSSWILFNDSQVSRISNDYFLTKTQKNVAIVCYKKASEEARFETVKNVRSLLPEVATKEAEAEAKAKAEAEAKAKAEAEAKAKEEEGNEEKKKLSFLIGKNVYKYDDYEKFTIHDIRIRNNKLSIQLKEADNRYYLIQSFLFAKQDLSESQLSTLLKFHSKEMIKNKETINKKGQGGGKRSTRRRKVDARKRKRTRKA